MKVEEPDLAGTYTYEDYLTWDFDGMVELIRGKIFKMTPAPTTLHQKISRELLVKIGSFLQHKKCQVFAATFDVRLPNPTKKQDLTINTVVQPDLCVICDPVKIDAAGCVGAPDWIIEILSPHTSSKDLREKFDVYEQSGVREYWTVHPNEATVLVFILNAEGKYESSVKPYVRTDKIAPITIPGLEIDLEEVFAG
jgi:Uma2 family endonuclease